MIKAYKFSLPKGSKHPLYHGYVIRIGWLKVERIGMKNYFMWRLELSNWEEK